MFLAKLILLFEQFYHKQLSRFGRTEGSALPLRPIRPKITQTNDSEFKKWQDLSDSGLLGVRVPDYPNQRFMILLTKFSYMKEKNKKTNKQTKAKQKQNKTKNKSTPTRFSRRLVCVLSFQGFS